MKLIGFIKEYNNINEAKPFDTLIGSEVREDGITQRILDYLDGGMILIAWMSYIYDFKTDVLLVPNTYLTDGVWVWPLYFRYYISTTPNMIIDNDFIKFMEEKNFEIEITGELRNLEEDLCYELLAKIQPPIVPRLSH